MKIDKFIFFNEMNDEQKSNYSDVVLNYKKDLFSFLRLHKDYIKNNLSGNSRSLFEKEVIKKEYLESAFLKKILDKLDDSKLKELNNIIIKKIIGKKEIYDSIINKMEYDERKLTELFLQKEKKKEEVTNFFKCIGVEIYISEEYEQTIVNNLTIDNLKKKVKDLEDQIEILKKEKIYDKESYDKELSNKNDEYKLKLEEKENKILNLENQIKELKRLAELEIGKNDDNLNEYVDNEEINLNKEKEIKKIDVDIEMAIDDLESRTLLGVVKAEGIQVDKNWIVVTPIVPIIDDNSNINRTDFMEKVDYRSDYSTFMLFISPEILEMCLSKKDSENYIYYSNDEKFNCLFEAFCKKILFFTPQFKKKSDDEKRKLNAELLVAPVDYNDFNNSKFVPRYISTKTAFENLVNKHEDLILDNYPASLSSKLKYIFVKDSIYEINYIPDVNDVDGRYIRWKFNGEEGQPAFKKLDIKIVNTKNDKYIFTPSPFENEMDDLYVKNIVFMQYSTKTNTIFDEDRFIANVSDNANANNLFYEDEDLKNFHIAIKSSNLVILAGPSGIGKTKLPMIYANTLGLDAARNTVLFVPISPSYLEPEDVLGYVRPSSDEKYNAEYIESNTGLVSFLIDASEHKDRIHLVIFDEMNLSQIEHWFAPFISLLEQDIDSRNLNLYSKNLIIKNGDKYPSSINIGENVFFVGTINIDETTKQISDRLLDRAIMINLSAPSFENLKNIQKNKVEIYPEISYSRFSTAVLKVENPTQEFSEREFNMINELNNLLINSMYNKGISFRSLTKMASYLKNGNDLLTRDEIFDFIILQIVVKKISGSREEVANIFTSDDTLGLLKILNDYEDISRFNKTRKYIYQKEQELTNYGFTR